MRTGNIKIQYELQITIQPLHRIILVDVRNSSELISAGKIPGSFNVPLHEIPEAFTLDKEQFLKKYKFPLPEKTAKDIVLTCRLYLLDFICKNYKYRLYEF